jgi:hypothetical protein
MLATIGLDDESMSRAGKIDNEIADRVLTTKLVAG